MIFLMSTMPIKHKNSVGPYIHILDHFKCCTATHFTYSENFLYFFLIKNKKEGYMPEDSSMRILISILYFYKILL